MPLKLCAEGKMVTACLIGEIDHHGAGKLREEIDTMLERNHPDTLILDFREVTFMDSSGIGLVMGRYRLIREWNGSVEIHKVMRRLFPCFSTGFSTDLSTMRHVCFYQTDSPIAVLFLLEGCNTTRILLRKSL